MPEFNEALSRGKQVEQMVLDLIKPKYPKSYIQEGYFKEWDIFVPEKNCGIEVKCDEMSNNTGNFLIEVEFDGKKSALSTTKAEYWVFFDGSQFVWIEPEKLRELILNYPLREFIGNGDTKYKKAYLVKKADVLNNSIHIQSHEA